MNRRALVGCGCIVVLTGCGALIGLGDRDPLLDPGGVPDASPDSQPSVPDGAADRDAASIEDARLDGDACTCAKGCNDEGKCLDEIVSVAVGNFHACVVRGDGKLFCSGHNTFGQIANAKLGNSADCGGAACSTTLTEVSIIDGVAPAKVRAVSAQTYTTCALTTEGAVFCFGYNATGQCGAPPSDQAPVTKVDFGGAKVKQLSLGGFRACAVVETATPGTDNVRCWGSGGSGELGLGGAVPPDAGYVATIPQPVVGLVARSVSANCTDGTVSAGTACAITSAGRAACWGNNANLGIAASVPSTCLGNPCSLSPTPWNGTAAVADIVPGIYGVCALLPRPGASAEVRCRDTAGVTPLANCTAPTLADLPSLVALPLGVSPTGLIGSAVNWCALASNGLYCFGLNDFGQLGTAGSDACGNAGADARRVTAARVDRGGVALLPKLAAMSRRSAIVYTTDGKLFAWGDSRGSFGPQPATAPITPSCRSGVCVPPTELTLPAFP